MKIDYRTEPNDPDYPVMRGKSASAKEFNKRMLALRKDNKFDPDHAFEQISTIIMEILIEDYDKRNAAKRSKKQSDE